MPIRTCEHVKANGIFCGSPALHGRDYCFFHLNCLGRKLQRQKATQHGEAAPLELPPLENADAIQVALMQVTQAILDGRLDSKRAGLVLYALQTASTNLRYTTLDDVNDGDTVCGDYDTLEEDYEIVEYAPALRFNSSVEEEEDTEGEEGDEEGRPHIGSYTDEDMAMASRILYLPARSPVPEEEQEELYADETDPEVLRQELRVAWAYVDRMQEKHRQELEKRAKQKEDTVYVTEKSAQPQATLFGVKKPPQSASNGTSVNGDALSARQPTEPGPASAVS